MITSSPGPSCTGCRLWLSLSSVATGNGEKIELPRSSWNCPSATGAPTSRARSCVQARVTKIGSSAASSISAPSMPSSSKKSEALIEPSAIAPSRADSIEPITRLRVSSDPSRWSSVLVATSATVKPRPIVSQPT